MRKKNTDDDEEEVIVVALRMMVWEETQVDMEDGILISFSFFGSCQRKIWHKYI